MVDDETDLVTTYERVLRRLGYATVAAGTRQAALDAIGTTPLKLVIADLRLPDGDGLDIVRAARGRNCPLPVIVVTGYASEASRRLALEAGAAAYVAKPFSISCFTQLVRDQLRPAAGPGRSS